MDPSFENVLKAIPGGEKVIEKFCAVFPSLTSGANSVTQIYNVTQADSHNGGNLSGNIEAARSTDVTAAICGKEARSTANISNGVSSIGTATICNNHPVKRLDSIPIKVLNAARKRDSKNYMLNLDLTSLSKLKYLREEILEQLGKDVVSYNMKFSVGYYVSSRKICCSETDNIKEELVRIRNHGRQLWCDGREVEESVICLDSLPPPKKIKADKPPNAAEQKAARVDALAVELQERHVDRFNKIQYKLWAEIIDCGKHKNKDVPPAGSIWNQRKAKP